MPETMCVLLVEDSEADALVLQRMLATAYPALRCLRAKTLAEAQALAVQADVVILDLVLPDSQPGDVLAWITACPAPVVVYSGAIEYVAAAAKAGALFYICKGVPADQLHVGIEFAIAEHAREQQRRDRRLFHIQDLVTRLQMIPAPQDVGTEAADVPTVGVHS